jgi:uncharacterized OB-fold protein
MSEPVLGIITPIRLEYAYTAGRASSQFLRALAQRRFVGQRCPQCGGVYVASRGTCAKCGVATEGEVEVGPNGTVTMFCIVNLPFYGQQITPPYACASILLDGAGTTIFHLIQEVPASEVRAGLRVEPVWVDDTQPGPSMETVRYFRPTGEPDAPVRDHRDGA